MESELTTGLLDIYIYREREKVQVVAQLLRVYCYHLAASILNEQHSFELVCYNLNKLHVCAVKVRVKEQY